MKTQFLICDKTENSGKPYIAECGSNTGDPESAMKFDSKKDAEKYIKDNEWSEWAYVDTY
jgi:hypothetical protein